MKILLSWIGFREDFLVKGDGFVENVQGFTISLHRDVFRQMKFEKHCVLCTSDRSGEISTELDRKKRMLGRLIKDEFPDHYVEFRETGIDKTDLQDFRVIESSLRTLLMTFDPNDDIHVVAGTGPTAVGMAWCTLNLSMKDRFSLHVLQRPEYVPGEKRSTLKAIEPFVSALLDDTLRESHLRFELPDDIFKDSIIEEEYARAYTYAQSAEMSVLILGETGCGKDRMAEFIQKNSPLAEKTYKAINCASLQDELLYSELFGHKKGSFTGATDDRKGLFEECNGGTLFLDEIGDISPYMQQSLLRTIENQEIKLLGSNEIKKNIKVRIIAATNVDLYQKCKDGKFRWDLYYRLSNPEIILQPYRYRPEPSRRNVIKYYISILEKKYGRKLEMSPQALQTIQNYSFPGNFREIYNTLNSLFPLRLEQIDVRHLPSRFIMEENSNDETYEAALKKHCSTIYKRYGFDLNATCKALGYRNVTQVKDRFKKWGILIENQK
jgi:transcriptional regulator with AAA-type ATPase domain